MARLTDAIGPDVRRLTRFSSVGILGTAVYYLALWLLVEFAGLSPILATNIAFTLVTIENYILHYHWTFASDTAHSTSLPRFLLMNAAGFLINWSIMYLGVILLAGNYLIIQAISITVIVIWNYLLSHFWIFRRH